jgi:hypothetical protein
MLYQDNMLFLVFFHEIKFENSKFEFFKSDNFRPYFET